MAGRVLLGVCAVLMAAAVASAAEGQVASVVVGLARCADCTRKNMKAETAFKGLEVAIKCKNTNGEYETKAVTELQSSGAFSVPLAADLHGADCHAQLHSAASAPCPGQEPSRIAPMSGGTFVAIPGKTHYHPSAECASAFLCAPIKKHFLDHFHKKKPVPVPVPEYHPARRRLSTSQRQSTTPRRSITPRRNTTLPRRSTTLPPRCTGIRSRLRSTILLLSTE